MRRLDFSVDHFKVESFQNFFHEGNPEGLKIQSIRISFVKKIMKSSTSQWSTEKSRRCIKNLRPAREGVL